MPAAKASASHQSFYSPSGSYLGVMDAGAGVSRESWPELVLYLLIQPFKRESDAVSICAFPLWLIEY